jgi:predicted DNA-binding antitoxin AbrB/MazE fold protein
MVPIDAIYDHGVFRPIVPVPLADQSRVRLIVESTPELPKYESFFEAASRLGLIGSLHGGPPDLSSNPEHMEGFGRAD